MHSVAKGEQWFHCCAEGFTYGMPCHNLYAEAVGYEKRNDFQNCEAEFRIAMKPGQRRVLPETPESRLLDLIETAKAHFCTKVEHPF
ncbi:hypothetical protein ICNINCKA_02796 [Synechococcus sp. CBW1107]|nr:hypothetical protein ICNINCKA_02796 [Synechococcus sp. CBW1107]